MTAARPPKRGRGQVAADVIPRPNLHAPLGQHADDHLLVLSQVERVLVELGPGAVFGVARPRPFGRGLAVAA